ncbi:hypothetical protein [uncultured Kordia sp.]|uniref:hypothetical protein n=1 Tax=uncultured Kordia sp. TaxID=507699 RepID=UPI002635199D|nr:hypothetical protein [uncultured Kordia sp.]
MKKPTIKNLAFKKRIISSLSVTEQLKGGKDTSQTSCWCNMTECACEAGDTFN